MPEWMVAASSMDLVLIGLVFLVFGILAGRWTAAQSLAGPLRTQIKAYTAALKDPEVQSEANKAYREQIGAELKSLRVRLDERTMDFPLKKLRSIVQSIILGALWLLSLLVTESAEQAIVVSFMLTLLWRMAAMDLEFCLVPETSIFFLALFLSWVTILSPQIRWSTPNEALIGLAVVATLISFSTFALRSVARAMNREKPGLLLGDGDTLVLLALSLYFGLDVLYVVLFGCLVMLPMSLFIGASERFWRALGHSPARMGAGVPFLPAIFVGAVLTVAINSLVEFSFNPLATQIIHLINT